MSSLAKFVVIFVYVHSSVFAEWSRHASDFFNMNVLCARCGEVCERVPYGNLKDTESVEAQHWACYVGCRTTCLLQVGAGRQKYDYESAKKLCVRGCHDEYKAAEDSPTLYFIACSNACGSKIIPPPWNVSDYYHVMHVRYQVAEIDSLYAQQFPVEEPDREPDEILFDPALREQYFRSGGNLPHSKYKTLPRHNHKTADLYIPYKRASGSPFIYYFVNFLQNHKYDLLLALLTGLSLFMLTGLVVYCVWFAPSQKKDEHVCSSNDNNGRLQPVTVLRVEVESEDKAVPPDSDHSCSDFIPPPTPPPKYFDVVQTV